MVVVMQVSRFSLEAIMRKKAFAKNTRKERRQRRAEKRVELSAGNNQKQINRNMKRRKA